MLSYFSTRGFRNYIKLAKQILDGNWIGSYTRPSPSLYPHQWNWDSGFIAIGYAHYNQDRAEQEILSLFENQWPNGMLPQIVFNPQALGHYFPEPDFWQVPDGRPTSGITMPPLHAIACWHIYEEAQDKKRAHDFLKRMFPRLMSSHRYFYVSRDPKRTGLVYIRHPWESGLDNSPAWDDPLRAIQMDKTKLPSYARKDLQHGVPREQRPSDDDYDRYVYLVDLFRRLKYREDDIYEACPFLIQDVLFNSILCRANRDLMEIGRVLKEDTGELAEWTDQTVRAISEALWCEPCKKFEDLNLITGEPIHTATAANFMPLFAGAATKYQTEIIYGTLNSVSFCALHQGNCFTIPNYDMTRDDFDPKNYWRGPVWININWMLSQGLTGYGYKQKADAMKKDMIQLPIRFGFHEYFDSQTGTGYGSGNFSWTAALFLDLVYEYYDKDKQGFNWLKLGKSGKLKETRILNQGSSDQVPPSPELACNLMATMGDLKDRFYDLNRGLVDYEAMKNSSEYRRMYQQTSAKLQDFDLAKLSSLDEQLAFWINLYNTIVVHGIVELGVSSSVREIPNFFSHIAYRIGGYTFSAQDIEHGILRANSRPPYRPFPLFRGKDTRRQFRLERIDPRIHFALVCGSRSCAPIRFYEPSRIYEQLDIATRNFVNSSEVVILPEEKKILLSQIFNWYKRDFGGKKQVFEFLQGYLNQDEKSDFLSKNLDRTVVEYLFYDWNLNH
jgi:thiol-disulfide isomerase/thioredoxin